MNPSPNGGSCTSFDGNGRSVRPPTRMGRSGVCNCLPCQPLKMKKTAAKMQTAAAR